MAIAQQANSAQEIEWIGEKFDNEFTKAIAQLSWPANNLANTTL